MTYTAPRTADQLAANIAFTRGEAAREARAARALDRRSNPLARAYALDTIRRAQTDYPKLTASTAAFYADRLDRPTWTPARDAYRAELAADIRAAFAA
jgi:hypothetical protein